MRVIRKTSVFAVVVLGMFVGSARAEETFNINVAFPFVVGQEQFPAGLYDIRTNHDSEGVVEIQGTNGVAAFVLATPADGDDPAGDEPTLVFTRHNNTYELSQIWESRTDGVAIDESSAASVAGPDSRSGRADDQANAPEVSGK